MISMKYIFLSAIFFILNYQSVYATENTMDREYFSEIHNTLQNNHYSRGECVAFEIDDNVKGGIGYYESPESKIRDSNQTAMTLSYLMIEIFTLELINK